mgnify:CR=1 FL=1
MYSFEKHHSKILLVVFHETALVSEIYSVQFPNSQVCSHFGHFWLQHFFQKTIFFLWLKHDIWGIYIIPVNHARPASRGYLRPILQKKHYSMEQSGHFYPFFWKFSARVVYLPCVIVSKAHFENCTQSSTLMPKKKNNDRATLIWYMILPCSKHVLLFDFYLVLNT